MLPETTVRRLLTLLVVTLLVVARLTRAGDATPKSLVVCLDGLRADAVDATTMPVVERLRAGRWQSGYGARFTARAQPVDDAPTLSGPNHAAILTGVTAARLGVRSNAPTELAAVPYPDYLALLERHDPRLGTAKLVAWRPAELIPSGADDVVVADDVALAERAAALLGGPVDALFLFLDGPDAAGHADGFESAPYREAVATADARLGRLLAAVAARPRFADEDWLVLLTTDHGGTERSHGGTSDAERAIPFLSVGRHLDAGAFDASVRNLDVAPTVLAHFGIDPTGRFEARKPTPPYRLDGRARVPVTPR